MVIDPLCPTISGHGLKVQVTPSAVPVQTNGELFPPPDVGVGFASSVGVAVALGTGVPEVPMGLPWGVAPPVGTWLALKVAVGKVRAPVSLLVPVLELMLLPLLPLLASPRLTRALLLTTVITPVQVHNVKISTSPT